MPAITAQLTRDAIVPEAWLPGLYRRDSGAVNVFLGVVRDHIDGRAVAALGYEAYETMAETQLESLGAEMAEKHGLRSLLVIHRLGRLQPGEVSLLLAVVSAHRKESLAATAEFIDRMKRDVPIWKQEFFEDGRVEWVEGALRPLSASGGTGGNP